MPGQGISSWTQVVYQSRTLATRNVICLPRYIPTMPHLHVHCHDPFALQHLKHALRCPSQPNWCLHEMICLVALSAGNIPNRWMPWSLLSTLEILVFYHMLLSHLPTFTTSCCRFATEKVGFKCIWTFGLKCQSVVRLSTQFHYGAPLLLVTKSCESSSTLDNETMVSKPAILSQQMATRVRQQPK